MQGKKKPGLGLGIGHGYRLGLDISLDICTGTKRKVNAMKLKVWHGNTSHGKERKGKVMTCKENQC
jgi:hypothetical protein